MPIRGGCPKSEVKDAILDASSRLIERFGYKKMTMDDLAREAGIGKGTIYLYFCSKEEVALSCADRNNCHIREQLSEIAASNGTPAERLRRMIVARVLLRFDLVRNYAWSLEDIFMALRSAFLARREQWLKAEAEIFAEVLEEGRMLGAFRFGNAPETAVTILTATNGLTPMNLTMRELGEREEISLRVERIADLVLHGVMRPVGMPAPEPAGARSVK